MTGPIAVPETTMPEKRLADLPANAEAAADSLAAGLFSEVFIADQLARDLIGKPQIAPGWTPPAADGSGSAAGSGGGM